MTELEKAKQAAETLAALSRENKQLLKKWERGRLVARWESATPEQRPAIAEQISLLDGDQAGNQ